MLGRCVQVTGADAGLPTSANAEKDGRAGGTCGDGWSGVGSSGM